jgi:hypothetical protein
MDLKAYVGAVVADIVAESLTSDGEPTGLAITFEDGRTLRAWSTFECPEEIAITEGVGSDQQGAKGTHPCVVVEGSEIRIIGTALLKGGRYALVPSNAI